jgi:DNA-directed RNA polymerase subunit E'/Rpb7
MQKNESSCYLETPNNKMFHTVYLDERVALSPKELNTIEPGKANAIADILQNKLREKYEERCNANGFVKKGSIELLGRSMGVAENGRFTGNIIYDCKFKCEIIYPTADSAFKATVIAVNKMGVYAVYEDAIRILLPRELHVGDVVFDKIEVGQEYLVKIDRSRFQTNDTFIMAVGRLAEQTAA